MFEDNKFKNSSGQRRFRSMFFETAGTDKSAILYTLKDYDNNNVPSLYRLYMDADDPTEYTFATTYMDGWEHWVKLCAAKWFNEYISAWRKELEVRTKARALAEIRKVASSGGKEAYQANKFLVSGGWQPPAKGRGAGRPSKDEVSQEAERLAREASDTNSDLERLQGFIN